MRPKRCAIAVIVASCLMVLFIVPTCRKARRMQKETQELSRMMSVRSIVVSALSNYYKTNSTYPRLFEELPAGLLRWGDEGSSRADLKQLRYNSTSNSFTFAWSHEAKTDLFVGGRTGRLFWSEEEFYSPVPATH